MVQIDDPVTDHEEYENFFRQGDSFEEGAGRQPRSLVPVELEERQPLTEEDLLRAARFRKPVTAIVSSLLLAFLFALAIRDRQPSEALASVSAAIASPTVLPAEASLAATSGTPSVVVEPQVTEPQVVELPAPSRGALSDGPAAPPSVLDGPRESLSAPQTEDAARQPAVVSTVLDRSKHSLGKATARAHVAIVKSSPSVVAASGAPGTPLPSQGRFPDPPR